MQVESIERIHEEEDTCNSIMHTREAEEGATCWELEEPM